MLAVSFGPAIPGIGPLSASALAASIGDAKAFRNGRQLAAWLGFAPRQHFSGGKEQLLGISKRGDAYPRTLLIHGARSVLLSLKRHGIQTDGWLARLAARHNAEWTWTATYTGDLTAPCGHVVRLHSTGRGAAVAEIENGKIKRFTDYYDMASFCRKPSAPPPASNP